jgi:hypothetical protein
MKKPVYFRFTPFVELPRRKRRNMYVSLGWKIRQDAGKYGGKFTSHLVLDEPGRPRLYKQWFDTILFLGSDEITIWNATIVTATWEFWSKTSRLAFERAFSLLSEEQQKQEGLQLEGPFYGNDGKYYRMAERPKPTYDCFGGLTLREYEEQCELKIIKDEPPVIHESFEIEPGYEYGIGLRAVVQADEVNREVIEKNIDRFRELGEANWRSEQPVPREALPFETQEMALSKVKYPA